jgi:hypothetical protein
VSTKTFPTHSTLHLQSRSCKLILDLMVTEGNKQKRTGPFLTLPLSSLHTSFHKAGVGCLLNFLPDPSIFRYNHLNFVVALSKAFFSSAHAFSMPFFNSPDAASPVFFNPSSFFCASFSLAFSAATSLSRSAFALSLVLSALALNFSRLIPYSLSWASNVSTLTCTSFFSCSMGSSPFVVG